MIMVDISGRDDGIRGGFQESIRAREKLSGGMTWAKWGAVIWPKKISRNFREKKKKNNACGIGGAEQDFRRKLKRYEFWG